MTNGEKIQQDFECEVCEPIIEDDIIHVIFADKNGSLIGFDWSWWNTEYKEPTTKNDLVVREFEEIVVEYPPEDLCTYPEYKGKPYFGIQYRENGENIVGYGTYDPQVLSGYLKDYFMAATKNDLGVDCISRADAQTKIEMNASRYTIAKERGGMGQVEWSDQLIKVSDAVDIIRNLPSVTPQLSSELEKNSKKLEKNFGESDCISREQVLEQVNKWRNDEFIRITNPLYYLRKRLNDLHPVTPIRPRGHWFVDERPESDREVVCSNCDQPIFKYHKLDFDYRPKYCPNCGSYNGGASNGNE